MEENKRGLKSANIYKALTSQTDNNARNEEKYTESFWYSYLIKKIFF